MLAYKLTQLVPSDSVSSKSPLLQVFTLAVDLSVVWILLLFIAQSAFKNRGPGLVSTVVIALVPFLLGLRSPSFSLYSYPAELTVRHYMLRSVVRTVDDYLPGRRTILDAPPFLVFTYVLACVSVVPLWRFWKTITDPLQVTGETAPLAAAETNTQDDTSDSLCNSSSFVTGSRSTCTQLLNSCVDTAAKSEDERVQQSSLAQGHFPTSESEAYAAIIHDRMAELDILVAEQDRAFAEAQALRDQDEVYLSTCYRDTILT